MHFCVLFNFHTRDVFCENRYSQEKGKRINGRVAALVKYYMNGLIPFLEDNRTSNKTMLLDTQR